MTMTEEEYNLYKKQCRITEDGITDLCNKLDDILNQEEKEFDVVIL